MRSKRITESSDCQEFIEAGTGFKDVGRWPKEEDFRGTSNMYDILARITILELWEVPPTEFTAGTSSKKGYPVDLVLNGLKWQPKKLENGAIRGLIEQDYLEGARDNEGNEYLFLGNSKGALFNIGRNLPQEVYCDESTACKHFVNGMHITFDTPKGLYVDDIKKLSPIFRKALLIDKRLNRL
tara:strand:- start:192 stop:740 length:549 start_codon:yes stop_codon:yes gene_type:complete